MHTFANNSRSTYALESADLIMAFVETFAMLSKATTLAVNIIPLLFPPRLLPIAYSNVAGEILLKLAPFSVATLLTHTAKVKIYHALWKLEMIKFHEGAYKAILSLHVRGLH